MTRWACLCFLLCLLAVVTGCARLPVNGIAPKLPAGPFVHALFDGVLHQFVDQQGHVHYAALKRQPSELDRYYQWLNADSPDNRPGFFPAEQDRLAYWLNAYNASVIKLVLQYYPLASVTEVPAPAALFFVPGKWRFFLFNRVELGQHETSLYGLEKQIRERFKDPRVHFALNCASKSCPQLPGQAFTGALLDMQLNQAAQQFLAEPRNLRIDDASRTVYLSSIFDWYADDFLAAYQGLHPAQNDIRLLDAIAVYAAPELQQRLRGKASEYALQFMDYDWGLNDAD